MLFQMSACDVSVSTCSAAPKQNKINTEIRIMSLLNLHDRTSPLTRMKHCHCMSLRTKHTIYLCILYRLYPYFQEKYTQYIRITCIHLVS